MAILSRTKISPAQRWDLEDYTALLSALRTDSKLFLKNFFGATNFIQKGFIVTGLGSTSASVVIADSTLVVPENSTDFSYFTAATGASPLIIADAELTDDTRNFLELVLTTESGTPISKVFWDSSLNSGSGAEFTQIVDTIESLTMTVVVLQGGFSGSGDALPLAILDVNNAGTITSIFDRRNLFGRLAAPGDPTNEHTWASKIEPVYNLTLTNNTGTFVTGETLTLGHHQMVLTDASGGFTVGETIQDDTDVTLQGVILSSSGSAPNITIEYYLIGVPLDQFTASTGGFTGQTSSATATAVNFSDIGNTGVVVTGGTSPITFNQPTGVQFFPETSNVSGGTSGANGTIATISEAFTGADKDLGTIEDMLRAIMTEIKKIKGTTFWYEDALKNLGNVDGSIVVGVGGGTANVQIITATPAFINLNNGLRITYKPTVTNTSGATITLDAFVPKACLKYAQGDLIALEAGDLVANVQADLVFVTQNDAFILLQPAQITDSQLSTNVVLKDTASTISGVMTFGTNPVFNAGAIDSADIADGTIVNADMSRNTVSNVDAYVVGGGTGNAQTATFSPAFTALVDGMQVTIRPIAGNTGAATFKLDGLTAKAIKKRVAAGTTDVDGDDIRTNVPTVFIYESVNDVWILDTPASVVTTNAANVFTEHQEINNVAPRLTLHDTSQGSNQKRIYVDNNGGNLLRINSANDDGSGAASKVIWDRTGKQTEGIVPLARMGVAHTFTFTSVATGTGATLTFTHGLGTDNIRILLSCDVSVNFYSVCARRPDGQFTNFHWPSQASSAEPLSPGSVSTGNVALRVSNLTGSTRTFVVKAFILRED